MALIADSSRIAAASWTTTTTGKQVDTNVTPSGFFIGRAATNLFRHGQCDSFADWNAWGTPGSSTATDATVPAPFSPQSIKVTVDGTLGGQGAGAASATGQAAAAGVNGVGSIWFKGTAGLSYSVFMRWVNTDATSANGTATNFTATGSWQLLQPAALAVGAGKTGDKLLIVVTNVGLRAESFWLAHAMLESGQSVVAPYVATSGGVTASVPVGRIQAPLNLMNPTQGWFAARIKLGFSSTDNQYNGTAVRFAYLGKGTGDTDGRIILAWSPGQGFNIYRSGPNNTSVGRPYSLLTFSRGDVVTIVGYYTATTLGISVNGAPFVTASNAVIPNPFSVFDIGCENGGTAFSDSQFFWFACGQGTLTNADAAAINGFTSIPTPESFPSSSQPQMVWRCNDSHARYGHQFTIAASGNEITDATRQTALTWGTTQSGGQTDNKGWSVVNWVPNPSFKTSAAPWNIFGGIGITGGVGSWNSTGGKNGTGCGQYSGTGDGTPNAYAAFLSSQNGLANLQASAMPVAPGQTIRARGSLYLSALSAGPVDASLYVSFWDNTGAAITNGTCQTISNLATGQWYDFSGTTVAPANAAYAMCRLQLGVSQHIPSGATFTVLCDNAMLCDNSLDPGVYVDGDTTGLAGTCSWWGGVSASFTRYFTGDKSYFIGRGATNLFGHGQCDVVVGGTTSWSAGGSGGTITITVDATTPAPFSPQSIKVAVDGSNNNQGIYPSVTGSWAAGTPIAASLWFKGTSGRTYKYSLNYYNSTAEKTSGPTTFVATGAWQLLTFPLYSVQTGDTAVAIRPYVQSTLTGADTFWVANAMVETGQAVVAPYVPTSGGASATKANSRIQAPANLLNATQGWIAMRTTMGFASANKTTNSYVFAFGASTNDQIRVWYDGTVKKWTARKTSGGVTGTDALSADTFASGDARTVVVSWASGTIAISINGAAFTSASNSQIAGSLPGTFEIGDNEAAFSGGNQQIDSSILWFSCGTGALADADAATIAAFANSDPTLLPPKFPGNCTGVWQAITGLAFAK